MLKWKLFPTRQAYVEARYDLLVLLEGSTMKPYVDGVGVPTIGIGFNLRVNLDPVLKAMIGASHWNATLSGRLSAVIDKTYEADDSSLLVANLNRVMANWHNNRDGKVPSTFEFRNDTQIIRALNTLDNYYDGRIDSWVASIPDSRERAALFSLCWNGPAMLGPKLKAAIDGGDRAEAWYEIRYNSFWSSLPDYLKPAIANRRYVEADMFGLYDSTGKSSYAQAIQTGQMVAAHHDKILGYEASYDPLTAAAVKGVETIGTISAELQPAIRAVLAKFGLPTGRHVEELLASGKITATVNGDGTAYDGTRNDDDLIIGSSAGDTLSGGASRDTIIGLGGKDILAAGAGADWFVFSKAGDSRMNAQDHISDFQSGTDKIVLSKLTSGLAPILLDKGEAFGGTAGEIRWTQARAETHLEIDLDGDGKADMGITLDGMKTLSDRDFLL